MSHIFRRTSLLATALVAFAACSDDASTNPIDEAARAKAAAEATIQRDLATARSASARYHDVARAIADGYVDTKECVASPAGGMGIHYVNEALIGNPALDPARPEVLLYEPQANGKLQLVGVEYMIPKPMWDAANPGKRPSMFGATFEDGPMNSYALHAWVWRDNPNGVTTAFNPKVTCPTSGGHGGHAH